APTFFPPALIESQSEKEYTMIDGGVFMNNPAAIALVAAKKLFPLAHDYFVISLGTGKELKSLPYSSIHSNGGIGWVSPLIGLMMSAGSETVDDHLAETLSDVVNEAHYVLKKYFRFQPLLEVANTQLDNATPENIKNLIYAAENLIDKHSGDIGTIVDILK